MTEPINQHPVPNHNPLARHRRSISEATIPVLTIREAIDADEAW
jgi:hypothetical protein